MWNGIATVTGNIDLVPPRRRESFMSGQKQKFRGYAYLLRLMRFIQGEPFRIGHTLIDLRTPALTTLAHLGKNVVVQRGTSISGGRQAKIGNNSYIGRDCFLRCSGGLSIGEGVFLGPRIIIITSNHNYDTGQTLPYDHHSIKKPVVIEDYVWIGAGACIVPGVTIREGAVVAMGAVVTKDVPRLAVVGGNPAIVLKYRDSSHYEELKRQSKVRVPRVIAE